MFFRFYRFLLICFLPACAIVAAGLFLSCAPSERVMSGRAGKALAHDRNVRVLLNKTKEGVSLVSSDKMKISEQKERYTFISPGKRVYIRPESVRRPLFVESWNQPISVNGTRYRGSISLHNIAGSLYVINSLKLNEYLYGVVPVEMPADWPIEALKAQAVAARTYALYHIMKQKNMLYDLDATTSSQVYKGLDAEKPSSNRAVDETKSYIIAFEHEPIISFFHSTCGGKTVDDSFVWHGSQLPYLKSVRCGYCAESPNYSWNYTLNVFEIKRALQKRYPEIHTIDMISLKKNQGRVSNVVVRHSQGMANMSGNDFRLLVSPEKIKSLAFDVEKKGRSLSISGRGWGHGVGLCQWGARGMAENGKDFRTILMHYYRNVSIKSIDGESRNVPTIAQRVSDSFHKHWGNGVHE
jgi:stage II sporulation protein D